MNSTKIYCEDMNIVGSLPQELNPQPFFKDNRATGIKNMHDSITEKERYRYGVDCEKRVLPYNMQDRYSYANDELKLKTVVLENDYLKAVFLPEHGGRLWSLYSKKEKRELLFVNCVFRPRNLAIRNAWFSGGIEWNLGHCGHHVNTMDDVYCAEVIAPDGENFLRIYYYEAIEGQVLQLDFHLPPDANHLTMYTRIENTRNTDNSLYFWTNTSVDLSENSRIFSSNEDIMYQLTYGTNGMEDTFGRATMPEQPNLPGIDLSYPGKLPTSIEYFFLNTKELKSPWEVSVEENGKGFAERSTLPLKTRKLYAWGNTEGGKHWCDYLSDEGRGDYIEIQAGLCPTQRHTEIIGKKAVVEFTQSFFAFEIEKDKKNGKWNTAQKNVAEAIDNILPESEVYNLHEQYKKKATAPISLMLHKGGFYAGLELERLKKENEPAFATHLEFEVPCAGSRYNFWLDLLQGKSTSKYKMPIPFQTDIRWLDILREHATKENANSIVKYHYAVSLMENGEAEKAVYILEQLSDCENDVWATYALGSVYKKLNNDEKAFFYYKKAYKHESSYVDTSFRQTYLQELFDRKEYNEVWQIFNNIPVENRCESEVLISLKIALLTDRLNYAADIFNYKFASVKEGATEITDLWIEYEARLKCKEENVEFDINKVDFSVSVPKHLEYRKKPIK